MSLRGLLNGIAGAILALALTASTALITFTTRMAHNTRHVGLAVESVHAAEEIELALLIHNRERLLRVLTRQESHEAIMREKQEALAHWLNEARSFIGSPAEAAIVQELSKQTSEYLERVERLRVQGAEHLGDHPQLVDQALDSANQLVDINLDDTRRIVEETLQWDELANILGLLVSAVLFVGLGMVLWGVRRLVYRPLLLLRDALVQFRPGTPGIAVHEAGPRELREMSREFNEMATRLERQREVQLRFIAGVAHDLRNPLSALKLSTEAVRPDRPLPSEEKMRERFALVSRQVGRIERMVEDLLDTARIESGQLELRLEEQDLRELVREAVALHEGMSSVHTLVLHMPESPVPVRCDATRISQVLNNLLSNAIKYSPRGGQVRVELTATPDTAWVAVSDSGVGIPTEERETIFEPFRRSTATRDTIPGVGLGLAVGRRIIAAHGGRIEVRSESGVGSTFRFCLPRVGPQAGGVVR